MGIRDNLRNRANSFLKKAVDFGIEITEPVKPVAPIEPIAPIAPINPVETLETEEEDKTSEESASLLIQLAEATAISNDIVRRLESMGQGTEAKNVVSATIGHTATDLENLSSIAISSNYAAEQSKLAVEKALQALNDPDNVLTDASKMLMKQANALLESASQAALDAENQAKEVQDRVDELEETFGLSPEVRDSREYEWDRKPEYIGFSDPLSVFGNLVDLWNHISYGVKRNEAGEPIHAPQSAPLAHAKGSAIDIPVKIPTYAYTNQKAFEIWAEDSGFKDGLSVEITGIITGSRIPVSR